METRRKGSKSGLSQIIRESRQPCKLSLYYTLIYPYLSYCNIVWSSTYNTHLNRIFILQKSAIHALSKSKYHAHTAPLFVKPKILNTYGVFMFHVAKFIFCFHHHLMLPSSFLLGRGGGGIFSSAIRNYPYSFFPKYPLHCSLVQTIFKCIVCLYTICDNASGSSCSGGPASLCFLGGSSVFWGQKMTCSEVIHVICICQIHPWKSGLCPPNFCLGVLRNSLTPPPPHSTV